MDVGEEWREGGGEREMGRGGRWERREMGEEGDGRGGGRWGEEGDGRGGRWERRREMGEEEGDGEGGGRGERKEEWM